MFGRKQLTSVYIVDDNSDAIEVLRRMLESQYSVKVILSLQAKALKKSYSWLPTSSSPMSRCPP